MRSSRLAASLLVFGLVLAVTAAGAAELKTLKGQNYTGDVVSIDGKEVVFAKDGNKDDLVKVPLDQVLLLDLQGTAKPPEGAKWTDVELTDGTVLRCTEFSLVNKTTTLTVLGTGQKVELPLSAVANVLWNAQEEKSRRDWDERVAKKRRRDVLARLDEGNIVQPFDGTLGDGGKDGKTISFTLAASNKTVDVALDKIHGLIFIRPVDPNAAPVVCRVNDTSKNVVFASKVETTAAGLEVTTPAGAKLVYADALALAKLDFSKGKLAWLSDLEPTKVVETSTLDAVEHYRRDKSLDNNPLQLDGVTHQKGLALHAHTELEYDLRGEYREFRAVAGIDDRVGYIDGGTTLTIVGTDPNGREQKLYEQTFSRQDKKKATPVTLNIKDVQKLRVIVTKGPNELFDLGKHLNLCDAKVSK